MRNKAIKIIALACAAFMLMSTGIYSQNTSRSQMDKVDVRVVSINLYAPHQGMDDRAPGMMKLVGPYAIKRMGKIIKRKITGKSEYPCQLPGD